MGTDPYFWSNKLYASGMDMGFHSKVLPTQRRYHLCARVTNPMNMPWAKGVAPRDGDPGLVLGLGSSSIEGGNTAGLLVLV